MAEVNSNLRYEERAKVKLGLKTMYQVGASGAFAGACKSE